MGEHRTCTAKVESSSLSTSTIGEVGKWLNPTDCKSVLLEFVGSNPTLSTNINIGEKQWTAKMFK